MNTLNLETKGNTQGFSIKFLIEKASTFINAHNWEVFYTVLALSIYGIILFPNINDFIDMTTICILLTKNLIHILLADVNYNFRLRHGKRGGTIPWCALLLYIWFLTHLPENGPFLDQQNDSSWPQRMGSLIERKISWYSRYYDGIEIIFSYENLP